MKIIDKTIFRLNDHLIKPASTAIPLNLTPQSSLKKKQSAIKLMTIGLLDCYKKCYPSSEEFSQVYWFIFRNWLTYRDMNNFKYDQSMKQHEILTEIPANWYEFYNNGYDLKNGDYIIRKDDIILSPEGDEYLIEELIGKGTFGQVIKCKNIAKNEKVAIKVLKNKRTYRNQGSVEI